MTQTWCDGCRLRPPAVVVTYPNVEEDPWYLLCVDCMQNVTATDAVFDNLEE